jgi:hypothetical protein
VTEPQSQGPTPDALVRERLRAARERGRFERDLDDTRDLLERRTTALRRTEARLEKVQRDLDRLLADPVVHSWGRLRRLLGRILQAPRRIANQARETIERSANGKPDAQVAPARSAAVVDAPATQPGRRIALLGAAAPGIRDALQASGWQVVPVVDGLGDVALVLDPGVALSAVPREVTRVGWIQADAPTWLAQAWLDELDLVLVGGRVDAASLEAVVGGPVPLPDSSELPEALLRFAERPRLAIQIGPATWDDAGHWGDLSFARSLERAFRRLGWATSVLVDDEAEGPVARRADVALHVVGVRRPPLHPGQLHLLWVISHPDAVRPHRCDLYDAVFVASDAFAEQLRARVTPPVTALHQATDPRRFFPEAGGPVHDLLLVGNARRGGRPVLDALGGSPLDLAVYGSGWRPESLDPRHLRGTWIRNEDLHRYYAAAAIVLNDHWTDMRDEGFISNRIYDALASGAFVLTDEVAGLDAEFETGLMTWSDPESLRAAIDRYLPDPAVRRSIAERGRRAVLERHTFDHRAAAILETIEAVREAHRP